MKNGSVRNDVLPGLLQSFGNTITTDATRSPQLHESRVAEETVVPESHTATRRLCAGAYLDRDFNQRLLREVYNSRGRRIAPSYGYDIVPLMQHAWRAWWLELARNTIAVALFIAALLTVPFGTLLMVGLLALWYALRACWRVFVESIRMLRGRRSYDHVRGVRFRAKLAISSLLGSIIVVGGTVLAMRSQDLGLRDGLAQSGLLVMLFVLLFSVAGVVRQRQLDRLHDPSAVKCNLRSRRLRTLNKQQNHPVTIYSGYRPFVGSGLAVRRWSFAQRIIRKRGIGQDWDEEFPQSQPPFKTSAIVRYLKTSIERLASTAHSETRLPGLMVRDHLFIDGMYISNVPEALSDPLSPTVLDDIMTNPREEARYHIACQVKAWEGELVTTVFVHISLQGQTLYVEFSTYALLPTPPRFRVIDEVGGTGTKAALRMVRQSLSELPDVLHAPRQLMAVPKHLLNAYRAQSDTTAKISKRRDIGARISARELAQEGVDSDSNNASASRRSRRGDDETSYFQIFDVARHSKIIERRLLAAIEEFLKTKNVDTSEFTKRAEAILNNGVLSTGSGTININGSAVGYESSVSNTTPAG